MLFATLNSAPRPLEPRSLLSAQLAAHARRLRRSPPCSLLAHHAPGIAHNRLAAVHAPPEPPPLATPAAPNVARFARRWREEAKRRQDASATCHMYVIEGGTCINCAAAAAAARSGVMPPILYLKLS